MLTASKTRKKIFFFSNGLSNSISFVKKNEMIYFCGGNRFGELGTGDTNKRFIPELVKIEGNTDVIEKVSHGERHTLVQMKHGSVYGAGQNRYGQLGISESESELDVSTFKNITFFDGKRVIDCAGGGSHSCFVDNDGIAWATGGCNNGQLGIGRRLDVKTPQRMKVFERIIKTKAGFNYSILLSRKKELFKSGRVYEDNECVVPIKLRVNTQWNDPIVKMSAGIFHFMCLGRSGTVYGIGCNYDLRLSSSFDESISKLKPLKSLNSKVDPIIDVSCGFFHSCALTKSGNVLGFGNNNYLGKYTKNNKERILQKEVEHISVGRYQVFMFKRNGDIICAGENDQGTLALGTFSHDKKETHIFKNNLIEDIKRTHISPCEKLYVLVLTKKFINVTIKH